MLKPYSLLQNQKFIVDISIKSPRWNNISCDINKYCKELLVLTFFMIFGNKLTNHCIEVSLLLTNNQELHFLNNKFRKKDKPTNILSFPSYNKDILFKMIQSKSYVFLGDIAISFEMIYHENRLYDKHLMKYFSRILVHGFLHLFGYTHESDNNANIMENLECKIIDAIDFDQYK